MKGLLLLVIVNIIAGIASQNSDLIDENICIGKDNGYFVNNPANCHAYWTCHDEIGYFGECEPGFHFNEDHQLCDLPDHVPCENPPTTETPPIDEDPFNCPSTGIHFFGIADSCTKYHFCFSGNHTINECSDDLQFDIVQAKCDRPEVANCEYRKCPPTDNLDKLVTHSSAQACEDYYICQNGVPQPFKCAGGIHWNQATQKCDVPANAQCAIVQPVKCPDDGDIHFLPNPANCQQYYVCTGDKSVLRTCRDGLLFDPAHSDCNSADSVKC